ncbi:MAG: Ig-like domain-containing protein, partial [Opitutaceae bacterium]
MTTALLQGEFWKSSLRLAATLLVIAATFSLPCESRAAIGPQPGQIVIDPQHPQWLMRQGGKHVFICGPGDPESFLYIGKCRPDGTRDGDQAERIKKLVEHGGNCIYMQIVRSHGGDARQNGDPEWARQNPFVDGDPGKGLDEDILNQWEGWFTLMDRHEILIYLFIYDDSARIWDTGDVVGPEEKTFVETIVRKFKHHKNLIWVVGEESEERYSTARVQAIAEIIKKADDHGHIIGNHHLSGTTFKAWEADGALNHFSMQLGKPNEAAHAGAIEALAKAAGRYQIIYSENTSTETNVTEWRRYAWSIATAGMMPMMMRMDIASTPVEILQQFRHLQRFFEATEFWKMSSHDELKSEGTKYVLADAGRSYIAYADAPAGSLGLKNLPAGRYVVTWLDCVTGKKVATEATVARAGDHSFAKPSQIGAECAVAIRRAANETTVIEDSLQGRAKGRQVGGVFGPEGYMPGLGPNHILYQLPRTVREGYVEFEVKGMDAASVPKDGDHGFMGMYDGRGVTEPATYFKDLKSNFYRWNVHWRQNRGGMKCVISCAASTVERRTATKAQYQGRRDWTAEPMGLPMKWDPAKWHRLRVEWIDKTFRVLVDGEEKWRASGPHDYAPADHRIWLGCAPATSDKYPCMVKDIVYRNFKVVACGASATAVSDVSSALLPADSDSSRPTRVAGGSGTGALAPAVAMESFKDDFEAGLGSVWTFPRMADLWRRDWISHAPKEGRNGSAGVRLRSKVNRPVHAVIGDFSQPAPFNEKKRLIVETDVKIEPENRLKLGVFVKGNYFVPARKLGQSDGDELAFYYNGYAFVIAPRDVTRLEHNVWLIRKCEEGGLHAKCGQMQKELGDRYVAGATRPIETGRWYRLRVEIEGLEFTAYIDDKKVIEYKEEENFYARDHHHVALYVHRNNHKPGEDEYEGDIYDKAHIGSGVFDNVSVAFAQTNAKPVGRVTAGAGARHRTNQPPAASDTKVTVPAEKETFIQLAIEDDDGPGPYTYTIVRAPMHGTLSGEGNDRFYTSKAGFTGQDEFTWKVDDGQVDSKIATVGITVQAKRGEAASRVDYVPPPDEQRGSIAD